MPPHRLSFLALVAVLALLAVVLPTGIVHCLAWYGAIAEERSALETATLASARRSMRILDKVSATVSDLTPLRIDPGCTAHTVARLRAATIATREIDEIGLYDEGQIRCNSWGGSALPVNQDGLSRLPGSTLQLQASSYSQVNPQAGLIGLYDGQLYAYVESGRLVDVVLPAHAQLAVLSLQGQLLASKDSRDLALLHQAAAWRGEGMLQLGGELFVRRTEGGFRSVASIPMRQVAAGAANYKRNMLPLTALASVAGVLALMCWARRRLSLVGELRRAILHEQLDVHYQPIIELGSGRCAGAEALVRWRHPSGDWIAPDVIIAKAERHGMVGRITELVMRRVMSELGPSLRQYPGMHVSINLSAQDMCSNGPLCLLEALLEGSGVAHRQLWLEVTERGFVDAAAAGVVLASLRRSGCQVAIDDFGTGFSSLAYLQSLPLDVLKVDKAFVDAIGDHGNHGDRGECGECGDSGATPVIDHIIAMARSLGLHIVAEGIEHASQASYLRARQVQYGQGWLFARAMPAADFIGYWHGHGVGMSGVPDAGEDQGHGGQ